MKFSNLVLSLVGSLPFLNLPFTVNASKNPHSGVITETLHEIGFSQSLTYQGEPLYKGKSEYQEIAVYQTHHFGKVLVLDDVTQLTERDGDSYNEMMAHIPMMAHPNPKRVLVIGGGDGYVLSEVLKHQSVEHVDHVDLDKDVIEVCKKHFKWGKAWEDPRVTLHISNGATFVEDAADGSYDVIIQDSSDPFYLADDLVTKIELPSGVLYSDKHYKNVHRTLRKDGVFNFQAETFNLPADLDGIYEWRKRILGAGFSSSRYGTLYTSTYPTGQIGFLLCQKSDLESNMESVQQRFEKIDSSSEGTNYYHPPLQNSSFDLPLWVSRSVYRDQDDHSCTSDK